MTVLIVASRHDMAAQNIVEQLVHIQPFKPVCGKTLLRHEIENVYLLHVDSDGIYTNELNISQEIECAIFASRHRSDLEEPTLTVHWTGNSTSHADFGGKPKTLSFTSPKRLRAALLALDEAREAHKLNYSVTLEATHHGPTELGVPTLFVEVGSTEREWKDTLAAQAAGEAIWKAATAPLPGKTAVGFGGGHYCNKQCVAVRSGGYAFSHILSKYFFEEYDENIVSMAFERTLGEKCTTAVIDWKGLRGPDRRKLVEHLKGKNIEIVRV